MKYINEHFTQTLEVKQSKFIAHLVPFSEYESALEELKREHPKARHFVCAYRYLNEYDQVMEYSTDDGEPKGTSGKPSLMVLQGADIINSAVIIVRYFGGTKLGTGGLVRAYSDAVNLVLSSSTLLEYKKEDTVEISFEYTDLRRIEYECSIYDIDIVEKRFEEQTVYRLKADKETMQEFLNKIDRMISILNR